MCVISVVDILLLPDILSVFYMDSVSPDCRCTTNIIIVYTDTYITSIRRHQSFPIYIYFLA